ncbi:hypothetical protein GpartN1_g98.t1 [Galdieria partita]|uniref:Integral membrane bound transporter domain-containing protein n=1 Tax=Galdieria partita TaxID=83374 RepID=A0A9C7PRA5_9RHOD|nr:hypothetical protein GpartN1_g98.t1 [Galdieria partita]
MSQEESSKEEEEEDILDTVISPQNVDTSNDIVGRPLQQPVLKPLNLESSSNLSSYGNIFEHLFLTPSYTHLKKHSSWSSQSGISENQSGTNSIYLRSSTRNSNEEEGYGYYEDKHTSYFYNLKFLMTGRLAALGRNKSFLVSLRGIVGYFLLSIFVFVPSLYNDVYGPLAIEMFLLTVTFGYEELAFGFISLGALQSTAALILAAGFGALGAYASRESYVITFFIAAVGSLLFTLLHSDSRMSFISSMGEMYFVFNLLDSHSGNNKVFAYFYETITGALLAHVVSLIVAGLLFPTSATSEMKRCLGSSLIGAGASLSKCTSLLLTPYIDGVVDPFDRDCLTRLQHSPEFLKHIFCEDISLEYRIQLHRAQTLIDYIIYEPDILHPLHQEPVNQWKTVINSVEDLLKVVQSTQSILDGERRRFRGAVLESWHELNQVLIKHFAFISAYCKVLGEYIRDAATVSNRHCRENFMKVLLEFSEVETYERHFREALKAAYDNFWQYTESHLLDKTAIELGPIMSMIIFAKSLLDSIVDIEESLIQLELVREQKSFVRMLKNLFGWFRVLLWPVKHWFATLKKMPRRKEEAIALIASPEFQFCCKKWFGAIVLLVILLLTPARRFALEYNGTWLWMAYVLYIQPSVEGTLLGSVMCLAGVTVGCTIGFLLMNWQATAMNSYLLNVYLGIVTGISVYFANSSLSITFITFAFTEYVIIFYQYSPFEYVAHWYYALSRFIMIFSGVTMAVILNEFVLPHSELTEIRELLAGSLKKMSTGQSWMLQKFYSSRVSEMSSVSSYSVEGRISVNSVDDHLPSSKPAMRRRSSSVDSFQSHISENSEATENGVSLPYSSRKVKQTNLHEIERMLLEARARMRILQNSAGSTLHAVPVVLRVALEQEQKLLNRLVAFETVMRYYPFITGSFQYVLHKHFIEPLEETTKRLVATRKTLTDVSLSCILDGRPFRSVQFFREFGLLSAKRTARVAWYSANFTRRTLKRAMKAFKERTKKKTSGKTTFYQETKEQLDNLGLFAKDGLEYPDESNVEDHRSYLDSGFIFPKNVVGGLNENNSGTGDMPTQTTALANSTLASDLFHETLQENPNAAAKLSTRWQRIVEVVERKLNTGSTKFGSVGSTMLDYIVREMQSGEESNVPPIVKNLQDSIDALRNSQIEFYTRYYNLEQEYQKLRSSWSVRQTTAPSFKANGDTVTYKYIETPYVDIRRTTPDDTILFFASFFSSSYVFDGFKMFARELIQAVLQDIERICQNYKLLIRRKLHKVSNKNYRKANNRKRRRSHFVSDRRQSRHNNEIRSPPTAKQFSTGEISSSSESSLESFSSVSSEYD